MKLTQITTDTNPDGWYNNQYTGGKENNSKQHYYRQPSEPKYGYETELQKNAEWMLRVSR